MALRSVNVVNLNYIPSIPFLVRFWMGWTTRTLSHGSWRVEGGGGHFVVYTYYLPIIQLNTNLSTAIEGIIQTQSPKSVNFEIIKKGVSSCLGLT